MTEFAEKWSRFRSKIDDLKSSTWHEGISEGVIGKMPAKSLTDTTTKSQQQQQQLLRRSKKLKVNGHFSKPINATCTRHCTLSCHWNGSNRRYQTSSEKKSSGFTVQWCFKYLSQWSGSKIDFFIGAAFNEECWPCTKVEKSVFAYRCCLVLYISWKKTFLCSFSYSFFSLLKIIETVFSSLE